MSFNWRAVENSDPGLVNCQRPDNLNLEIRMSFMDLIILRFFPRSSDFHHLYRIYHLYSLCFFAPGLHM